MTTYTLKWLKLKTLTAPTINEQPEFSLLLEGMKMVQPVWKTNTPPTKLPSCAPPKDLLQKSENISTQRLEHNVYNAFNTIAPK